MSLHVYIKDLLCKLFLIGTVMSLLQGIGEIHEFGFNNWFLMISIIAVHFRLIFGILKKKVKIF